MRLRTVRMLFVMIVFCSIISSVLLGDQMLLAPSADVYVISFGGGEGCNPFIKYNISPISSGQIIDSVFLTAFIWQDNASWDGDVNFWNVNSQVWTESDSSAYIWSIPTSDSLFQPSGFGMITGWSASIDIKDIFLTDYTVGNTFCSIKMKDPDDGTFNTMPGSYPIDSDDTLAIGDRAFGDHIYFYPHEYTNGPPWLVVHYHATGIDEEYNRERTLFKGSPTVSPNPCTYGTSISYELTRTAHVDVKIYDLLGRQVRKVYYGRQHEGNNTVFWDGRDDCGIRLNPGIYFSIVESSGFLFRGKIYIIR